MCAMCSPSNYINLSSWMTWSCSLVTDLLFQSYVLTARCMFESGDEPSMWFYLDWIAHVALLPAVRLSIDIPWYKVYYLCKKRKRADEEKGPHVMEAIPGTAGLTADEQTLDEPDEQTLDEPDEQLLDEQTLDKPDELLKQQLRFMATVFLYPCICNHLLSVFRCRSLGGASFGSRDKLSVLSVLLVDYDVECNNDYHRTLKRVTTGVIVVGCIGWPVWHLMSVVRHPSVESRTATPQPSRTQPSTLRKEARKLRNRDYSWFSGPQTIPVSNSKKALRRFNMLDSYKAEYCHWDLFDCLRTLLVTLVITDPLQLLPHVAALATAAVISFGYFFVVDSYRPFRQNADTVYKAATEVVLFLVAILGLALEASKTTLNSTDAELLSLALIGAGPIGCIITIWIKCRGLAKELYVQQCMRKHKDVYDKELKAFVVRRTVTEPLNEPREIETTPVISGQTVKNFMRASGDWKGSVKDEKWKEKVEETVQWMSKTIREISEWRRQCNGSVEKYPADLDEKKWPLDSQGPTIDRQTALSVAVDSVDSQPDADRVDSCLKLVYLLCIHGANPSMVRPDGSTILDKCRQSKSEVLSTWGRVHGTFKDRYYIDTRSHRYRLHMSQSSQVVAAFDRDSKTDVVLKFIKSRQLFDQEVKARKWMKVIEEHIQLAKENSGPVIEILHHFITTKADLQQVANEVKDPGIKAFGTCVMVMKRAQQSLAEAMSHDHIAGRDGKEVKQIARQIAEHLHTLEKSSMVHGDIKPLNIVMFGKDARLIDMDASKKYGEMVADKHSDACTPPEIARLVHRYCHTCHQGGADDGKPANDWDRWQRWLKEQDDRVLASVSFDMWSFGILLYRLCVLDGAHIFNINEADNLVNDEDLCTVAYRWDNVKLQKLEAVKFPRATDLILWCLQSTASRRPQSFADVLKHPFLLPSQLVQTGRTRAGASTCSAGQSRVQPTAAHAPAQGLRYLASVDESWESFVRRQSIALHQAIDKADVTCVKQLFDLEGGVHISLQTQVITADTAAGVLPLHRAARACHTGCREAVEILQFLLDEIPARTPLKEKRVILDARIHYDYTAYMVACDLGHLEAVQRLVNAGCSTRLKNSFGQTGLELAYARQHASVYQWLREICEEDREFSKDMLDEFESRDLRPDVQTGYRDELQIAPDRLTFWAAADEFDLWNKLGGGAYGDIYEVPMFPPLQLGGDKAAVHTVVVKAVKAADKKQALAALRAEIQALCSLEHPHIVRVYGFSNTGRPLCKEDKKTAEGLRSISSSSSSAKNSFSAEKDSNVLVGAVRLARHQSRLQNIPVDPLSLYRTYSREDLRESGESAKKPTWALLLEQCDCDLTAPIYNKHPWSQGATLSWVRRLDFAQQMASGLAYIHANKQKHWDLKPGNILLKQEGEGEWVLKVADFGMGSSAPTLHQWLKDQGLQSISTGLATSLADMSADLTIDDRMFRNFVENKNRDIQVHDMAKKNNWHGSEMEKLQKALDGLTEAVGTPEYMAPEAWRGGPVAASDVFSFGLILWELCTQKRVHEGFPLFDLQCNSIDEHIPKWMATKDARPEIPSACPKPWALLVRACWAAEPAMRPTFDDIAAALRAMIPLVKDWAATHTVAAESTETTTAPTVQQWMETLGLGTKVKAFVSTSCLQEGTKYLEGVKTIEDEEFRELLEDVDDLEEAIDEMVGEEEDELTEEEVTKLKAALRALLEPTSPPEQAPATAPTVQQWMKSLSLGAKVEAFINMSGLQEGKKYLEGVKTIEGEEFRELLEDMEELDEAVDEMIGEEDGLTEEEAARLKAALRALRCVDEGAPDETAGPHADVRPWTALCTVLQL
eukprot:SAG25_NODE_335_length_9565_cov_55.989858_2_plen_1828_part_00